MELQELQKHWNDWGKRDPLWAILSDHGGRSIDEFFERGREEGSQRLAEVRAAGIDPLPRGRALDFGCGMGRLTQAFCDHFDACDGVDIAPSMIDLARQHNRHGDRCRYHVNPRNDLSLFADRTFAFVYTALVLQHMKPRYALNYIREFCRVLAPGGVAMFQAPGEVIPAGDGRPAAARASVAAPLPEHARRAEITPVNLPDDRPAGMQFQLRVNLRNASDVTWPAARTADGRYQLVVANRWFDETGKLVESDDGRTLLPHDLKPGESVEVPVIISAPQEPGRYAIEVDVVEDGARTLDGRGMTAAATMPLRVVPAPDGADGPVIQMYGIPKVTVIGAIESGGARLVEVAENGSAGAFWTSYTYVVQGPHE